MARLRPEVRMDQLDGIVAHEVDENILNRGRIINIESDQTFQFNRAEISHQKRLTKTSVSARLDICMYF